MAARNVSAASSEEEDDVRLEYLGIYRELFVGTDSEDEFEGFAAGESDSDGEIGQDIDHNAGGYAQLRVPAADRFGAGKWQDGPGQPNPPIFTALKGITVDIPDDPTILDCETVYF